MVKTATEMRMELDERRRLLRERIAEQDRVRGRPLTAEEKINNLEDFCGFERGHLVRIFGARLLDEE